MVFYTAVHFRCLFRVDFGSRVVAVGSHENLGKWEPRDGHKMSASSTVDNVWNSTYPVHLPLKERVEYRYAVLDEKEEFVRWCDELIRHVEPTGNDMIVEDDGGFYRSECSSYPKSFASPKLKAMSDEDALNSVGLNHLLSQPEISSEDKIYFVTSRLPVQVFRRKDGKFGIRESNTPLTTMLWELRNRFRNKMKFVGACSITFETEHELLSLGLKSDHFLHSTEPQQSQPNSHTTQPNSNTVNSGELGNVVDSVNQGDTVQHDNLNDTVNNNSVDTTQPSSQGEVLGDRGELGNSVVNKVKGVNNEMVSEDQFTECEQNEIRDLLLQHDCIPVFVSTSEINKSVKFCKKYMWNLFYNIGLWDITKQNEFDWDLWQSYCKVNKAYALVVAQYLGRSDFTWVHDYKLLMVPQFLSRRCKMANIGLYMHAMFPSFTLFACLAVREEILRSMLCADLVGFHYFEFARHFLTSCRRILGLEYSYCSGGMIAIDYNGRQVMIRMSHAHVQADLLQAKIGPKTRVPAMARELKERWPDRFIVASVDRDARLSGLLLKFRAFRKFLQNYPYARNKILLVQYVCTIDTLWEGRSSDVYSKLSTLVDEINHEFKVLLT